MSNGTLRLAVVLDAPSRCYYGSDDPITGHVVASFSASHKFATQTNSELLGPLRISVTLHGRAKTKLWKSRSSTDFVQAIGLPGNAATFRGRLPLFSQETVVYNDAFKSRPSESHTFPFEINFPTNVAPGSYGGWKPDAPFLAQDGLPPSFLDDHRGHSIEYKTFVEYQLGTSAVMQGLKVEVDTPDKHTESRIWYERPRLSLPVAAHREQFRGIMAISNEFLMRVEDRPSSFKQKMKAAFRSDYYPKYAFTWTCTGPRIAHLNESIQYRVSIQPLLEEITAQVVPQITLLTFSAEIYAITKVRAEKQTFGTPEASGQSLVQVMHGVVEDPGPFSDQRNWTTIHLGLLQRSQQMSSTFSTLNISHGFTMTVKLTFDVAQETKSFKESFDFTILPPLAVPGVTEGSSSPLTTSSSTRAGTATPPLEGDDADPILPEYQRPPEYEADLETCLSK